ncbi:MAG: hypothetical protein M1834_007193 [Cirrosporium novae-zelandiae]|nr:MAG: hypothetical protein M1834_007193 [Cirrosporium novae-zelandiae]
MVAISKPSLRATSLRSGGGLTPASANAAQHNIPISTRRTKRTRSSVGDEGRPDLKKIKLDVDSRPHPANANAIKGNGISTRRTNTSLTPSKSSATPIKAFKASRVNNGTQTPSIAKPTNDDETTTQSNGTRSTKRPVPKIDKRILRSQDGGSRTKSDLSYYFANYDELISLEPTKNVELLNPDTVLEIIDGHHPSKPPNKSHHDCRSAPPSNTNDTITLEPRSKDSSDILASILSNTETVDLSSYTRSLRHITSDPLPPSLFSKPHHRQLRRERQLRNIERERAQHEKIQLDRLLEGLQGPDWLRVMGITAITDSEKKPYEPKREYFIKEVEALINKFRVWKEEEKRRKEEEKALREETENDGEGSSTRYSSVADTTFEDEDADAASGDGTSPSPNSIDASAARQLHLESSRAGRLSRPRRHVTLRLSQPTPPPHYRQTLLKLQPQPPNPPFPATPLTSFYSKPHLRDAALGKHRSTGRTRMAFGQPVPELEERDFELPSDWLTEESIRAAERYRRARRRESRGVSGKGKRKDSDDEEKKDTKKEKRE